MYMCIEKHVCWSFKCAVVVPAQKQRRTSGFVSHCDGFLLLFHAVRQKMEMCLCLKAIAVVPDPQQGCLLCPVLRTLLWLSSFDPLLTCHNPSQAPN